MAKYQKYISKIVMRTVGTSTSRLLHAAKTGVGVRNNSSSDFFQIDPPVDSVLGAVDGCGSLRQKSGITIERLLKYSAFENYHISISNNQAS